jgi:nitroimidazol reductase NimA-like FMN-containing flavoprotein (pyridoxamine 5'-phosphate oxidase superfamily)
MMSLTMRKEEREAFLAEVHVAIISIPESGRGPLTVPVWYAYAPEEAEFRIWTGGNSRKARLLRQAGRFSLCVQQETRPYRYVSAEGPVVAIEPIQLKRDLRPLVYRYLGTDEGNSYIESLGGESAGTGDILIRMKPERWLSEDYSKLA